MNGNGYEADRINLYSSNFFWRKMMCDKNWIANVPKDFFASI
jgi:hypothetical protein